MSTTRNGHGKARKRGTPQGASASSPATQITAKNTTGTTGGARQVHRSRRREQTPTGGAASSKNMAFFPPNKASTKSLTTQTAKQSCSHSLAAVAAPSTHHQRTVRLLQLAFIVFLFHGQAALLTEAVFQHDGFRFGWVYCLFEFGLYVLLIPLCNWNNRGFWDEWNYAVRKSVWNRLTFVKNLIQHQGKMSTQLTTHTLAKNQQSSPSSTTATRVPSSILQVEEHDPAFLSGVLLMISHGAGTSAFEHLSFTFGAMCKSAKVPCILLGRRLYGMVLSSSGRRQSDEMNVEANKKIITSQEYIGSLSVFFGLTVFGVGERFESPRFSIYGLALMLLNICCASVGVNIQQVFLQQKRKQTQAFPFATRAASQHRAPQPTTSTKGREVDLLMMIQYSVGFVLLVCYTMLFANEFQNWYYWYSERVSTLAGFSWDDFLGVEVRKDYLLSGLVATGDSTYLQNSSSSYLARLQNFFYAKPHDSNPAIFRLGIPMQTGNKVLILMFLDNFLSFWGLRIIFKITKEYDAARTNAICGCRKMITFALSYVIFPKVFGWYHLFGLVFAILGGSLLHVGAEGKGHKNVGKTGTARGGPESDDGALFSGDRDEEEEGLEDHHSPFVSSARSGVHYLATSTPGGGTSAASSSSAKKRQIEHAGRFLPSPISAKMKDEDLLLQETASPGSKNNKNASARKKKKTK
ncbi:unnamed protein product [Amoebophrya sp. A120]|nr:unnamed protein product [Amoebophrya sp. A120]|eukprot:GSA120T00009299001.1